MSSWLDMAAWDVASLRGAWQEAGPFAHVVIDDAVPAEARKALLEAAAEEPCDLIRDPIFTMYASAAAVLEGPALAAVRDAMASPKVLAALSEVTGRSLGHVNMRAFAYHSGHYLLPHTDHDADAARLIAYALYLETPEPPTGGELDLFACRVEEQEIVATEVARTIEPTPNRLVLFEVGPTSLHQVREVTAGIRLSLAGWFYA